MKLTLLLIFLFAVIFEATSFPVISSSDWCHLKTRKTTIKSCIVKPDSLRSQDVYLNRNILHRTNQASGIVSPDKNGMCYRTVKPVHVDPQIVIRSSSVLIMK